MTAGFVWPLNGPKGFSHPVFRDNNSPAYRSDALRAYLTTPGLRLGIKAMVRRWWATSSPAWHAVGRKSNGVAGPCFRHGRQN